MADLSHLNSEMVVGLVGLTSDGSESFPINSSSGNRLLVDAQISSVTSGPITWSNKLRYDDMNVSNGGVAREAVISTSWQSIYSYSGSGMLISFITILETGADWEVRLVCDSDEIFSSAGISMNDMASDSIYDADHSGKSINELDMNIGLMIGSHDRFMWNGPLKYPLKFSTNITILVKRRTGTATKKFRAGLVVLQKDT